MGLLKNMNIEKMALQAIGWMSGIGLGLGACLLAQAQEIAMPDTLPDFVANGKDTNTGTDSIEERTRLDADTVRNAKTEIKINQPYNSQNLGQLLLPFMWEVSEDSAQKRIVATEVRTHAPAVLTIDLIDNVPSDVSGESYAQAIIGSIAESLSITDATQYTIAHEERALPCEKKKKCPKMSIYRSTLAGNEEGVARQCAIDIVPNGPLVLVLTLCAAQSVSYEPGLAEVVDAVFGGMQ